MTEHNAARLLKAVQQDQALQEKMKAASDPEAFVKLAAQNGYYFTATELLAELDKLSEEKIASIINPGMAPRHHIHPR